MTDIKQPQDRKPKAPTKFTFKSVDGKTEFSLPLASEGAEKLTGRETRDALMNGDAGELKLGFILLERSGADQTAIDSLYDRPNIDALQILGDWMKFGDGDGASVPQS